MKTQLKCYREYRTIDKSSWGNGEWQNEPDKAQWIDEETELPCLIVRQGNHGALCGYVGIAEGHKFFGMGYLDVDEETNVHGGLTFSDSCQETDHESQGICHVPEPGQPSHVWWFGFDCSHAGDISPGYSYKFKSFSRQETYKNIDYVKDECQLLAKQLKALAVEPSR